MQIATASDQSDNKQNTSPANTNVKHNKHKKRRTGRGTRLGVKEVAWTCRAGRELHHVRVHIHGGEVVLFQPSKTFLVLLRAMQAGHGVVDGPRVLAHPEIGVRKQQAHVEGPLRLAQGSVRSPETTRTHKQAEEGQHRRVFHC